MSWLKVPNFYAYVALVVLGGAIVTGIYQAGVRSERNKHAAATAALNTKLVSVRAYDEAELAAEAAKAAKTDAEVRAALRQKLILTEESAALIARVR